MTGYSQKISLVRLIIVAGEICRYLPKGAAIPVRLESGNFVALSPVLIDVIGRYFRDPHELEIAEIRRLAAESGTRVKLVREDTVLVPEIFGEQRAAFYAGLREQELRLCRFIIYDLLPFTHPEYFPPEIPLVLAGYYHVVRRANRCGFISEYTQHIYCKRLKRADVDSGVVLPLGCDALGPRSERPALNRPLTFSVLGTVEPRKNHDLILEAFEPLLRQVEGLNLYFIGKMGWVDSQFTQKVHALNSTKNSGFRFFATPDDGTIKSCIEQSRATIYVSAAEGYGLPPVESLWLGTPVIASNSVPSVKRLGSRGIHYVEPLNVINLRRAILAFLDDTYANQKIEQTTQLNLPTWRSFTEEVVRWCVQE